MTKLITGGTGVIGAELTRLLVERGEEVVLFDISPNLARIEGIQDKIKMVRGDLGNWSEVLNVVKDNGIKGIYHLGSMLSLPSQANPWASFRANVVGTYNMFEAARLFDVERVVFSSTGGTFGLETGGKTITDTTIQRPTLMYGVGKLYCEGLGRFYRTKFGLDYRGIRYPGVIAPGVTTPGAGQWFPWMIEHAIQGKPYECFAPEFATIPALYVKDCARAANTAYEAPKENIKMVNYNIAGVQSVSGGELAEKLRKRYPGAKITFKPDPEVVKIWKTLDISKIDDSCAREELGWAPLCTTLDDIISEFEKEMKEHPQRYGLA